MAEISFAENAEVMRPAYVNVGDGICATNHAQGVTIEISQEGRAAIAREFVEEVRSEAIRAFNEQQGNHSFSGWPLYDYGRALCAVLKRWEGKTGCLQIR